jgi:AIPR protein
VSDFQTAYDELREDIMLEAEAGGIFQQEAFFRLFAEAASENGDTIDLEHAHSHRDGGSKPYRIDGHAFDLERGTLHLAICDFRDGPEVETLVSNQIASSLKRVLNFFENALRPEFINSLEDTSPAFEAAYPIYFSGTQIKRVRIILFSNARLAARQPPQLANEIANLPVVYSVLDLSRFLDIQQSRSMPESIEVNISAIAGFPVPCLKASVTSEVHESYLLAIPGPVLAEIYGLYGARLLEQNVRTYLQARTKVNQGILRTIKDAPEMFFAYNNGITATASAVKIERLSDGQFGIASVSNLQIVNGGQTTASILYAKDVARSLLDRVHVPMKLSVVPPESVETVVPNISRYANTQNRISEADFFSSHAFHLQMEKYSRRLGPPPQAGALAGAKWFYERARGQYRDGTSYASVAEKRKFLLEFPKDKMIVKTDLAKYLVTFEPRPDIVSRGAQKCFMYFAEQITKQWKASQTSLNEGWYRNACSMALLFRWTDRMVARSTWYATDRGHKSQTVTYTLAWLVNRVMEMGKASLNLQQVWNSQDVPEELAAIIEELAPKVAIAIRATPDGMKNVGEYCKTQACWEKLSKMDFAVLAVPDHLMLDREEQKVEVKEAAATAKIDSEIDIDLLALSLVNKADLIRATAQQRGLLSPKSIGMLKKLEKGGLNLTRSEKNSLKLLVRRLEEEGAPVGEIG